MSGTEIVVILLLALVVLGPEKLPDAIRKFGKTYAELKKMGTGFQQEFKSAIDEPMREMRETADLLRKSTDFTSTTKPNPQTAPKPVSDTVTDRPARNDDVAPADPDAVPTDDVPFAADDAATVDVPSAADAAPDEDVVAADAVPTVDAPLIDDDVAVPEGPSDGRTDRGGTDDA
ncbi:MAG TPA: twin-arginine translocase TatA/TatE family subunit [Ilumatobacteraceae bacterium]|nr:twin-arginine translocase TatA/TatE family subunit [Ilumatobacteraceae bacterium]